MARLDQRLVELGLAADLKEAQALVLAGKVLSGDTLLESAAAKVGADAPLRVRGRKPFASRAGVKLEAALDASGIDVQGLRCLDLGASTGGFTHCLLKRGASSVLAIEKGKGQLAWALSQDPRVESREQTDALSLSAEQVGKVAFACADISFSPLAPFLPLLARLLPQGAAWVLLVKPQFELPASAVPRGGVVRDAALQQGALEAVLAAAERAGLGPLGSLPSPLPGVKGNREWLCWGRRS